MSATNRKKKKSGEKTDKELFENYPTPEWCPQVLLKELKLPSGKWFEPAAGSGSLISSINSVRNDIEWYATEIRHECKDGLIAQTTKSEICNFVTMPPEEIIDLCDGQPEVIITNPPFSLAMDFIFKGLLLSNRYVVMLLRLNFLGSKKRKDFFRLMMPDLYVMAKRPSFVHGKTDATEFAWFVWDKEDLYRTHGKICVLDTE